MAEEHMHRAVCGWLAMQYPKVIFNSDMSGVRLHQGLRKKTAKLRSHRAFPDLFLYHGTAHHCGLALELKTAGTRLELKRGGFTKDKHIREQAAVLAKLRGQGYYAEFAAGLDEALAIIRWYIGADYLECPVQHLKFYMDEAAI